MGAEGELSDEVREQISVLVRSGFWDEERILEILGEEMYAPGELPMEAVAALVEQEFRHHRAEQSSWPKITDCDRLERAFAALEKRGVITLENAGFTQSDGYSDFVDAYRAWPDKARVVGYCFYHGQDTEAAVRGQGLHLAFGPVDPKKEQLEGPKVGQIIREELERAGLIVEWNGTFNQRLFVPRFVWQRRSP